MLEPREAAPKPASERTALDLPTFHDDLADLFDTDNFDESAGRSATPWWRRRVVMVVAGILIVVLIASFAITAMARGRPQPVTYQTAQIATGRLLISVSATGPVQAASYSANFTTSGRVAEIDVRLGQQVKAGQQLAKLDTTALQDALNQAQIQANGAWDQEQNALASCTKQGSNAPPQCVAAAENASAASLGQLKTAQDNLNNATLTAPHAATVTAINGTVGGSSSASGSSSSGSGASSSSSSSGSSSSSSSGFIDLVDSSSLQVQAGVNEADISGLQANQAATFTVSAYGSRAFRATVGYISPIGTSSSNVVTYPVTMNVDMTSLNGAHLLTGMTATISITTAERQNVLLLPTTAITFARAAATTTSGGFVSRTQVRDALVQSRQLLLGLQQRNAQVPADNPTLAYVRARPGSQWVVKPVVLGLSNGTAYEVLAGLSAGDSVVTGQQGGTLPSASSSANNAGTGAGTGAGGLGGGGFFGGGGGGRGNGGGRGTGGNGGAGGSGNGG